jgi:hypothetical protein
MIMSKTLRLTTETSRRLLLQGAAVLVGIIPFMGGAVAAGKMSQGAVAYQGSPKGSQSCANCKLFEKPDACKLVDGKVSPNGWCRIWAKA